MKQDERASERSSRQASEQSSERGRDCEMSEGNALFLIRSKLLLDGSELFVLRLKCNVLVLDVVLVQQRSLHLPLFDAHKDNAAAQQQDACGCGCMRACAFACAVRNV